MLGSLVHGRALDTAKNIRRIRGRGGGVFGALASPRQLTPPHPHQKSFPPAKNEMYQRGQKFEAEFRYTNFFLASDPHVPGGGGGGSP